MIKVTYENVDITSSVQVNTCLHTESSGGKADSLNIHFADPEGLWSKWQPKKGERIKIEKDGFSSGVMFVDKLGLNDGIFKLAARSLPPAAKTKNNRIWERIRFLKIASDLATAINLSVETHGITNHLYDFFSQSHETDLQTLNRLCIREGYVFKVFDEKAIVYNEKELEAAEPALKVSKYDMLSVFEDKSEDIYSACEIRYLDADGNYINYIFNSPAGTIGEILYLNEQVYSYAEAARVSQAYLRYKNKFEVTGSIKKDFNSKIASGNTIELTDIGLFEGKYFIHESINDLISNKSILKVRKVLEGY